MYIITKLATVFTKEIYDLWAKNIEEKGKDIEKEFPPPITREIVCLGYMVVDEKYNIHALGIGRTDQETEKSILQNFSSFVNKHKAQIISWNGKRFDLPIIVYRCLHHLVQLSWYYERPEYRYRFATEGHLDLADYVSDYFSSPKPSLDCISKLIGLPGRLWDPSNIDVMYFHNDINAITEFCVTDIIQIYAVFLRVMYLRGLLGEEQYNKTVNDLKSYITKTADGSQNPVASGCNLFLDKWNIQNVDTVL